MRSPIARSTAVHRILVAVVLIVAATNAAACRNSAAAPDGAPWERHVQGMDDALGRGDVSAAIRARNAAYATALESSRWEALVTVGDAFLRIAQARGEEPAMLPEVRRAYLRALFCARDQRSVEGILRVAEAFASLGDRDVADQVLVMASALAASSPTAPATESVWILRERQEQQNSALSPGVTRPSLDVGPAWNR
jgi:hypothetical protein